MLTRNFKQAMNNLEEKDILFIDIIRGASILRVMLMHLGLGWFYMPYSTMFTLFFPVLFFVSGAVTFNSFLKSHSSILFLIRRVSLILIPYIVFMLLAVSFFSMQNIVYDKSLPINWSSILVIRPIVKDFGVHFGHIWFLQALLIMTLISVPLLSICKKRKEGGVFILGLSFCFILTNQLTSLELEKSLKFGGVNFYLGIANLFFFSLGILYFTYKEYFTIRRILLLISTCFLIFLGYLLGGESYNFSIHRNQVGLIYVAGATTIIFIALLGQNFILAMLMTSLGKPMKKLMLFMSRHAFALFLIHIPILAIVEFTLLRYTEMGRVSVGLMRIPLVIVLSSLIAPSFTTITSFFTIWVSNKLKIIDKNIIKGRGQSMSN